MYGYLKPENGGHDYTPFNHKSGIIECRYGCGCCLRFVRSSGPEEIDSYGLCPKNPVYEQFLVVGNNHQKQNGTMITGPTKTKAKPAHVSHIITVEVGRYL